MPKDTLDVSQQIPSTLTPSTLKQLDLGPHKDMILKAASCIEALEYNQAIHLLNQVTMETNATPTTTCAILFGRGLAHYKLERYAHAEPLLRELKGGAQTHPSHGGCVFLAEVYLGNMCAIRSEHDSAAACYEGAIRLYSPVTPQLGALYRLQTPSLSQLHTKRGGFLRKANKMMQALEALREGVATAGDDKDLLSAHTSLGNLHQGLGDSQGAVGEYLECVRLAEKTGDKLQLGWNHGNLGNAYVALQQRDRALHHLQISLELALQYEPTPSSIGRAYNNLGTAYQALSELDRAEEYYKNALDQAVYGKDTSGQARALGNLGNISMLRKDYDNAYQYFTETLGLTTETAIVSVALHNKGCCLYEKAELALKTSRNPCPKLIMCGRGIVIDQVGVAQGVSLTPDLARLYKEARQDMGRVVAMHEDALHTMKGTAKGLTLAVSLLEASSRTFHRLQDCLCVLGMWEEALCCAEQSRARTLGELLLKRLGTPSTSSPSSDDDDEGGRGLVPPLSYEQICEVVRSQGQVVVYLSYTGSRLLSWVMSPDGKEVRIQLHLDDVTFEDRALDQFLRYGLPIEIADKDLEMFGSCDYSKPSPLHRLHALLGDPILKALSLLSPLQNRGGKSPLHSVCVPPLQSREVVLVPDSYTVMPFIALCDPASHTFMGDTCQFHTFPSILTLALASRPRLQPHPQQQGPLPLVINIPGDSDQICVVGDPNIPPFTHGGEKWSLGRLPHAADEARWVGHILGATPILHEHATKPLVVAMLQRSKVIHIATHGSSVSGFLAFAGQGGVTVTTGGGNGGEDNAVLLFPHEVEQLAVGAGLVVLSSCDSGRGTVRADGVQGMCRAFLLAGAQAILTTLWRVPDESAGLFMQFFYRYLMDGLTSAQALQMAVLSVRCFEKYSKPVHWGAYQLTGRTVQFEVHVSPELKSVMELVGKGSVFPRLDLLMALEGALVTGVHVQPSYVQVRFVCVCGLCVCGLCVWFVCVWFVCVCVSGLWFVCVSGLWFVCVWFVCVCGLCVCVVCVCVWFVCGLCVCVVCVCVVCVCGLCVWFVCVWFVCVCGLCVCVVCVCVVFVCVCVCGLCVCVWFVCVCGLCVCVVCVCVWFVCVWFVCGLCVCGLCVCVVCVCVWFVCVCGLCVCVWFVCGFCVWFVCVCGLCVCGLCVCVVCMCVWFVCVVCVWFVCVWFVCGLCVCVVCVCVWFVCGLCVCGLCVCVVCVCVWFVCVCGLCVCVVCVCVWFVCVCGLCVCVCVVCVYGLCVWFVCVVCVCVWFVCVWFVCVCGLCVCVVCVCVVCVCVCVCVVCVCVWFVCMCGLCVWFVCGLCVCGLCVVCVCVVCVWFVCVWFVCVCGLCVVCVCVVCVCVVCVYVCGLCVVCVCVCGLCVCGLCVCVVCVCVCVVCVCVWFVCMCGLCVWFVCGLCVWFVCVVCVCVWFVCVWFVCVCVWFVCVCVWFVCVCGLYVCVVCVCGLCVVCVCVVCVWFVCVWFVG